MHARANFTDRVCNVYILCSRAMYGLEWWFFFYLPCYWELMTSTTSMCTMMWCVCPCVYAFSFLLLWCFFFFSVILVWRVLFWLCCCLLLFVLPALYLSTPTHHKYNLCLVVHSNNFFLLSFHSFIRSLSFAPQNSPFVLFFVDERVICLLYALRLMRRRNSLQLFLFIFRLLHFPFLLFYYFFVFLFYFQWKSFKERTKTTMCLLDNMCRGEGKTVSFKYSHLKQLYTFSN